MRSTRSTLGGSTASSRHRVSSRSTIAAISRRLRQLRDLEAIQSGDRKSTRLNSSHLVISYADFCLKKKNVGLTDLGPGEVHLKVVSSGVCHSDVSAQNGTIPAGTPCVLGHEGAGIVLEVGPVVTEL